MLTCLQPINYLLWVKICWRQQFYGLHIGVIQNIAVLCVNLGRYTPLLSAILSPFSIWITQGNNVALVILKIPRSVKL